MELKLRDVERLVEAARQTYLLPLSVPDYLRHTMEELRNAAATVAGALNVQKQQIAVELTEEE